MKRVIWILAAAAGFAGWWWWPHYQIANGGDGRVFVLNQRTGHVTLLFRTEVNPSPGMSVYVPPGPMHTVAIEYSPTK